MDRGAWWATVHRVAKRRTWWKQLSVCAHTHTHTPGPNMETLFKTNNRDKYLQSSQRKRYLKYRGIKISMTADFTKEIMQENRAEPLL